VLNKPTNNTPLVSVVTAAYNAEKFILQTIQSVLNQTYDNWEMLIVDDVSTDQTREIVTAEAEKDNRIKLICLENNSGAALARNHAIREAKGRYIAFLDSDDIWLPSKLEKQVYFMLEKDIAFSFTGYGIINEGGIETNKVINVPKVITYDGLLKNTIIGCLTVMLDQSIIGEIQMTNIRTRQDFALWLNILKRGYKAYGIQEELAKYRLVEGSISSNKLKAARRNWMVYREIEKLSLPYACWCFINYAFNGVKKQLL
jgi:teichuronic acid biosynthesis glycosyltransferase TuaG